jgi:biotin carboxylase
VKSRPILLVGYSLAWQEVMAGEGATDPVVFVEEPDVARKRDVDAHLEGCAAALIRWEYQLAGAADRFYLAHRDLDPVAILPGVEYAVPFAARLAERYGVAGAGLGAATILSDKALLRAVTSAAGIPNPSSERVESADEVRAFMYHCDGPIVLKPANRQASVGTQVLRDIAAVDAAWVECTQHDEGIYAPDRAKPLVMLAEQFVAGDEYSVELLVRDGEPLFSNVTEKHLFDGPRPIELGHAVPAPVGIGLRERLVAQTRGVLDAVGFQSGFVHCEWIVMRGVPYLVECAGRMPGDLIVPMIDTAWGTDIVRAFATVMRGDELPRPLPVQAGAGAGVCFVRAEPGEVVSVRGLDDARALDGVLAADVLVAPGDRVNELRSSWDRVGYVSTTASTSEQALALAQRAAALICVDVLPDVAPSPVLDPVETTR